MHQTLVSIKQHLSNVIAQVRSAVPNDEPFGNAHNNWSFPGLTRAELIEEAQSIIDLIDDKGGDEVGGREALLNDYLRRLAHLQNQTVDQLWSNANQAVPAYMLTLQGLRRALEPTLTRDGYAEAVVKSRELTAQLRGLESRLQGLEPRTISLTTMVERIENAYNAADQLPTELESLAEARQKIADLLKEATQDGTRIVDIRDGAVEFDKDLRNSAEEAKAVLADAKPRIQRQLV